MDRRTFLAASLVTPFAVTARAEARVSRLASAVARAAVETETSMAQPRLLLRRIAGKTVVACSPELAVYADKLGQVADDLAANDPLPPPLRAFQELYEVAQPPLPPGCQPFSNERLLKLAAAMSKTAAVSSRQELYPRGMAADRTLRLGIGALSGLGLGESEEGFTPDQVRARVESRYPEAERLPDHPELQRLLEAVGMEVRWDAETKKYHRPELIRTTSGSSQSLRLPTAQTARHQIEVTPDVAEARIFEDQGGAVFKAVRGDYGCGKTFFARWVQENAKKKGFATAEVQISETETPLHRLETVYRAGG